MLISHIPENYLKPSCTCICPMETTCNSASHPATSESCPVVPGRQSPLCSLPCCFPSLSQSQWLMAITCARGVTSPQHSPAWDLSPTTSWHTRQPNIWLWLVPHFGLFPLLRALRTSKERRGKFTPHCTGTGLESSQKQVGSNFQKCASTKHCLFNSCLQIYRTRLPSMSCWPKMWFATHSEMAC